MEAQSQLQSLLSLLGANGELFPDPVESGQSVSRRARCTAQGLTEDDGRLQQLTAVIIGALKGKTGEKEGRHDKQLLSVLVCFKNNCPFLSLRADSFQC